MLQAWGNGLTWAASLAISSGGPPDTIDDQPPLPMPEVCPVTLDEPLAED